MTRREFQLQPFSRGDRPMPFTVEGSLELVSQALFVRFNLSGDLRHLDIPAPAEIPGRCHRLWEGTCFELFVAEETASSTSYREINLSPSGHWNVYRFQGYRLGMAEEKRISSLPFRVSVKDHALRLDLEMDLTPLFPAARRLDMGISCVLKERCGTVSYWALTHCAARPDFHCRESFLLSLPRE